MKIDELDRKIMSIIAADARIPFKDVAALCGVSRAAVHQRVQRLVETGVVTGSGYNVNPKYLGYSTCTYVGIRLEKGTFYQSVVEKLKDIPEIVECHCTTGPYAMIIKAYVRDNEQLMRMLTHDLQGIDGVEGTETMISLEEAFHKSLPILEGGD